MIYLENQSLKEKLCQNFTRTTLYEGLRDRLLDQVYQYCLPQLFVVYILD